MSDKTCPYCSSPLDTAYLYVRGLFGSLHVSSQPDTPWLSRSNLTQIRLDAISETETGAQAVVGALHCANCKSISFRTTA